MLFKFLFLKSWYSLLIFLILLIMFVNLFYLYKLRDLRKENIFFNIDLNNLKFILWFFSSKFNQVCNRKNTFWKNILRVGFKHSNKTYSSKEQTFLDLMVFFIKKAAVLILLLNWFRLISYTERKISSNGINW